MRDRETLRGKKGNTSWETEERFVMDRDGTSERNNASWWKIHSGASYRTFHDGKENISWWKDTVYTSWVGYWVAITQLGERNTMCRLEHQRLACSQILIPVADCTNIDSHRGSIIIFQVSEPLWGLFSKVLHLLISVLSTFNMHAECVVRLIPYWI